MLLGVVLLYVGVVLIVNGLWLLGQARAAEAKPTPTAGGGGAVAVESHPTYIENREVAVLTPAHAPHPTDSPTPLARRLSPRQ